MFRTPAYLEKKGMLRYQLDTSLTMPGNGQYQTKTVYRFLIQNLKHFFNWHNAYFRVDFTFQATANGANVDADTASTPVNGSFSLLQKFEITSNGVSFYDASGIHKVIFITKLLEFFNDYARSSAKDRYWYLDASNDSDTAGGKANAGATARGALSHVGATVKKH